MPDYWDRLRKFREDEEADTTDVDFYDISPGESGTSLEGNWGHVKTRQYGSPAFDRFLDRLAPKLSGYESTEDKDDELEHQWIQGITGHSKPLVFYHGVPTKLVRSILKSGLKGGQPRTFTFGRSAPRGGVYLAETPDDVIGVFANELVSDNTTRGQDFSILEVKVPEGMPIAEDPEYGDDDPGAGYWVVFGTIPPQNIKVIRTFKAG